MIRASEKIRAVSADADGGPVAGVAEGTPLLAPSGSRSRMATSRWSCAAACIRPNAITIIKRLGC
jgi:hypothetical protein